MGATILTKPGKSGGYDRRTRLEKAADARKFIGKSRYDEGYTRCATTACDDTAKCHVGFNLKQTMDNCLRLIIYRDSTIFDNVIVSPQCVLRHEQSGRINKEKINTSVTQDEDIHNKHTANAIRLCTRGLVSYLVSAYVITLSSSHIYRDRALAALSKWLYNRLYDGECIQIIFIRLRMPRKQFLDYKWNERLLQLIMERQEADHAMSWLSTLGGAFSALGEEFEHCAEMAGKISVRQFELALRLDNPLLIARCRLYSALSLIQRGHFRTPRHIIKEIYKFALLVKDERLGNMCHGIWAKLQYCHKQYNQRKKLASSKV